MFINKNNLVKVFTALIFQFFSTMNLAYAVPCEDVFKEKLENDGEFDESGKLYAFLWNNGRGDMGVVYRSLEDFRNKIYSDAQRYVNKYGSDKSECRDYTKNYSDSYNKLEACLAKVLANNNCDASAFKNNALTSQTNDKSNQSPSSGSSSQSNKKANRQSANNQSSSSGLSEQTIKKINEAVDQTNIAHDNKDYAKSIAALNIILAYSKNITVVATASNRLAGYYNNGYGVPKDEVKAQALFEQASINGDADADTHICENYENGTGGVIKNHQTAIKYCTAAATKGQVSAMGKLGYLYHAGEGTYNPQLGNEWLCKAAKKGESTAIRNAEKLNLNCN